MSEAKKQVALPEYHQSALGMFLKCPKQYEFRYMMKLVLPPRSALTVGRAIDTGITHNMQQKVESKTDLSLDVVLDAYSTSFDKEAVGTDWDGDDAGSQKDLGAKITACLHKNAAPNIQPVTVQEGFRIETDAGYALGGTFDITDANDFIRDTKSSKANYDENAVSESIQAAMYDFAFEIVKGRKAKGFAFDVGTKHKEPRYQEVVGEVSAGQRSRLFESIRIMHAQIQRGEFQYAPEGAWWCSSKWCGYWSLCKGKK